jgi:hypothetical protein
MLLLPISSYPCPWTGSPQPRSQRESTVSLYQRHVSICSGVVRGTRHWVLFTGLLDDGVAGLWETQQNNGTTVVQDPDDALYRSMPENAIRGLPVQYIVPIAEMAPLLSRLVMNPRPKSISTPSSPIIDGCGQSCPECGEPCSRQASAPCMNIVAIRVRDWDWRR